MKKEKINVFLTILLFVQIVFVYLLSYFQNLIEEFYSNGIYIYISSFFRILFGWIPFSIGDIIYSILIILFVRFLIRLFKYQRIKQSVFQLFSGLSVLYFCFYFFWGLNYFRQPLSDSLQLKKGEYDVEKLKDLTDKLLGHINEIQIKITTNDTLAVEVPYTKNKILEMTHLGYQNISRSFKQFQYEPSSIKKSLFSLPLTYMGFSGYFNPLTGEAQVDHLIPKVSLLMTCSHEVAHQLGIASESEANFIGFLAASQHDDLYFQYSAYLLALRYALFDIYRFDPELYKKYNSELSPGILKNIRELEEFWTKYENPIEPFFKIFYDSYLKVNQQKHGIRSYSKMIDLLIAYDDKYSIE